MVAEAEIEVRRSARRTRTVTVFREGDQLVAVVPARLSVAQEQSLLPPLVERFLRRETARRGPASDAALELRARQLHERYLATAGGRLRPFTIRWVDNQQHRWGSCTAATGDIRISARLRQVPTWVSDYVVLHELAHLYQPNHSADFHRLLAGYPDRERAAAFLAGYQYGAAGGAEAEPWQPGLL